MTNVNRPILVTIVGALNIIEGLVIMALVMGVCLTGPDKSVTSIAMFAIAAFIAGFIPLIIGIGQLKGWRIMWYLGVIFAIIGVIGGIIGLVAIVGIIPLIINALILYYLFRPGVKAFFNI